MKQFIVFLILLLTTSTAVASGHRPISGYPAYRTRPAIQHGVNISHYTKTDYRPFLYLGIGTIVICTAIGLTASENNPGQIIITKF